MRKVKIGMFVGSARTGSYSAMVAQSVAALGGDRYDFVFLNISNLPVYNQDLDSNPPKEWTAYKKQLSELDGFIFVTPEHNRATSAMLKNAIDVASRPYGDSSLAGKLAGVISQSPGKLGGYAANATLRESLNIIGMQLIYQPQVCISESAAAFDDKGKLVSDSVKRVLESFLDAFNKYFK